MKVRNLIIILVLLPLTLAAEPKLSTKLGLYSAEIFRGVVQYDGIVLEPEIGVSDTLSKRSEYRGGIQAFVPIQGERDGRDFTEIDASAFYLYRSGPALFSLGALWYQFSNDSEPRPGNTGELAAQMTLSSLLRPSFSLYQDIAETNYRYFEIAFSHPIFNDVYERNLTYLPFVKFGYSWGENEIYESDGLNHIVTGVQVEWQIQGLTLKPGVFYNFGHDAASEDKFWAGASISKSW